MELGMREKVLILFSLMMIDIGNYVGYCEIEMGVMSRIKMAEYMLEIIRELMPPPWEQRYQSWIREIKVFLGLEPPGTPENGENNENFP